MMKLLIFKEYLKRIYASYTAYVEPGIKFAAALIVMLVFNANIGYMSVLRNPAVVVIIALLCAFMPLNLMVVTLMAVMTAHIYALTPELALLTIIILMIMFILYFRFTPADGYILLFMPVLFFLRIPYAVPLIMGLIATPISIVSISFGTLIYFMIQYISENAAVITNTATDNGIQKMASLLNDLFNNKGMYLLMIAFAGALVVAYIIRRKSIDYAWSIAIITGGLVEILIILAGVVLVGFDTKVSLWLMVATAVLSVGIVYVLQFFILSVDYTRTEYVQFEDEDYYYYVKAVPKVNAAPQDVKVKRINARKVKTPKKSSRT